jgi:hypothetical protein
MIKIKMIFAHFFNLRYLKQTNEFEKEAINLLIQDFTDSY